jgi:predicted TIM-barrel fold metal-dependent hydrolase
MIIDFHTHIFSPDVKNHREKYINEDRLFASLYSNPRAKLITADDLISAMDEQHIDKSVILNIGWESHELCVRSNDYLINAMLRFPERLIAFCMVKPDSLDLALRELEQCSQNGVKGIGEMRPTTSLQTNEYLGPIVEYMTERKLILLTHSSEPVGHIYPGKGDITPEHLYPLIQRFPGLKIVCAHWGGGLPFYSLMPEVKTALENVYFDSAASPFLYTSQVYAETARLAGIDKILFGSDYPLLNPQRILNEISALKLTEEQSKKILSENATTLLNI